MKSLTSLALLSLTAALSSAGEDSNYQSQVRKLLPVVYWSFDGEKPALGEVEGTLEFRQPGPAAKDFKTFRDDNCAVHFRDGKGLIRLEDVGPGSQFDFDNGDPIAIEAWVSPDAEPKPGANMYLIGKGRTGNPGFDPNNQNFGLRLWEAGGYLRLSWVFRSRSEGDFTGDWHRWTSRTGIRPGSGWHHLALSYRFGDPKSIAAYIDGEAVPGDWDMGGATTAPPVVDDDDIWVGASMKKSETSAFRGRIDELALYRRILTAEQLTERHPAEPYTPRLPEAGLPEGKVRVEIVENLGKAGAWPKRFPAPADVYEEEAFGFFRIAQKYVGSGVRADRSNPYLLRAMATVIFPEGEQEILLRTRGKGRLWLDGQVIAETEFANTGGGAHNEVHEMAEVKGKDLRYLGPGDREILVKVRGDGKPRVVALEMIAGNGRVRPTLGETSVSVRQPDGSFVLLSPGRRQTPLTDAGWESYRAERMEWFAQLDRERRLALRAGEDEYWQKRHIHAREVAVAGPPPEHDSIDGFLQAAWDRAGREADRTAGGIDFESQIQPILAEHCYRCHDEKTKGGLRLSDRSAALKGGDSELPALAPGKPEESYLIELIQPEAGDDIMPPTGEPLPEQDRALIAEWIRQGASYAGAGKKATLAERTTDLEFLRRVTLDVAGVMPSSEEAKRFLADDPESRRARAIDRLLADGRWADHWTAYWQDALAENPNILKPSLNNTGPFRYWIHEALTDNLPMDRFVTELILMEGSVYGGGPAGFGMAAENDVPMAAKAHILATAFLGVEMNCARCHDAPYHKSVQKDLFEMAAMLNRGSLKLPASSSVPLSTFEGRKPLIQISLKPGEMIAPAWPAPFAEAFAAEVDPAFLRNPEDTRERLAALITAPENRRFAGVIVNRVWRQLMGHGLVEPVDDWEASKPLYPELLDWLARELVSNNYDMKHLVRLVLNSDAYQRKARTLKPGETPDFAAPVRRRMTAEQVVDSLFAAAGRTLDSEELTMDIDGTQTEQTMISLGFPRRSWELTSLSNERDRPSLAIPKAQAIVDLLENFGWRSSRQEPKSERETAPNVRQPAIMANGSVGRWVTGLSEDSAMTELALRTDLSPEALVDEVFLRLLTREPAEEERNLFGELLSPGFAGRIVPESRRSPAIRLELLRHVSWSNHLSEEANRIKIEMERRVREGAPPTLALDPDWRERMEDMLWAVLNSPEFVYIP